MKLAKTRFRPRPRSLALTVHFAISPVGLPSGQDFSRWVSAALKTRRPAEIGLRIVDAEEGQALNREYREKDYATNVLSFALNEGEDFAELPLIGDVVLCAPVVEKEAIEQNKTLLAHYAHLTVHGMLHLQGFDHEDDADAAEMEKLETAILARLGYADPYHSEQA